MPILKSLPATIRHRIYRSRTQVPKETFDPRFTVEIASKASDLERAFGLLHDCYVKTNLMYPNNVGWRCDQYSLSPHTTTVVVKDRGLVVGTVALIRDSYLGLPSDKEFKVQNDQLRFGHRILTEVSALAVADGYRVGHHVSFLLMKYLHNFAKSNLHSNYLVCAVHPLAEDFYKALFGFERHGPVVNYNGANGALGIHISFEISEEHEKKVLNSFRSQSPEKNPFAFILKKDERFKYPEASPERCIYPVLSRDLKAYYREVMNLDIPEEDRETRIPINLSVRLRNGETILPGRMRDITSQGCYIELDEGTIENLENFEIHFQFQNRQYRIPVKAAWKNKNASSRYSTGIGIRFLESREQLKTLTLTLTLTLTKDNHGPDQKR